MRTTLLVPTLFLLASAVASCGDGDSTLDAAGVQAFRSTAERMETEARNYQEDMQQANAPGACRALADEHLRQLNALIGTMTAMAADMDGFMSSRGNADSADLSCTTDAMLQEVSHHAEVACTLADMQGNREEAMRHADLVEHMAEHQQAHAAEMLGMMGEMHAIPDMRAVGACTPDGGFDPGGGHHSMPGM